MSSLFDLATWEPLLNLLREQDRDRLAAPGGCVSGQISQNAYSLQPPRGDTLELHEEPVLRVMASLKEAGRSSISFVVESAPHGKVLLHLLDLGPAVQPAVASAHPGSLLLVEGAVPEPWRRLPEPAGNLDPAPSADPARLTRTLHERLPDAIGATEAEIAAAEARLGVPLPEELRALYRVTRSRREDLSGDEAAEHAYSAVGCEVFPLEDLYLADPATRPTPWCFGAMKAAQTLPDDAVQGLVGSPGWLVFGASGRDRFAVDLTPGPRGHLGQIIMLPYDLPIGADLVAASLTDLVTAERREWLSRPPRELPWVAHVNWRGVPSIAAAADPRLEVLSIGVWEGPPLSLAPVLGLPRLRTLCAYPGTLCDPLEIGRLTGLEYLEIGPAEWRLLLEAGAVPRSLLSACIHADRHDHPLATARLANDILALWMRPPITDRILEWHPH